MSIATRRKVLIVASSMHKGLAADVIASLVNCGQYELQQSDQGVGSPDPRFLYDVNPRHLSTEHERFIRKLQENHLKRRANSQKQGKHGKV